MIAILTLLVGRFHRYRTAVVLGAGAVVIVAGAGLFALTDHVSFGTGVYWAFVTASTVGYGDVTPHNTAARIVAVAVILTLIPILAALFARAAGLFALVQFRRLLGMEHVVPSGKFSVVYGLQPAIPEILQELRADGRKVVLVAAVEPSRVPEGVQLLHGDPTDEAVIRKSRPEAALNALVACPEDGDVLVTCVALRSVAPNLEVFALARSPKTAQALRDLGVSRTLSSDELVAHTLAKSLEAPHAGELLLQLIDSERFCMDERPVGGEMVGRTTDEVRLDPPGIVLGVLRGGEVAPILQDDPKLRADDVLITLSTR